MVVYIVIDERERKVSGVFSTYAKAQDWIDEELSLAGDTDEDRYDIMTEEVQ